MEQVESVAFDLCVAGLMVAMLSAAAGSWRDGWWAKISGPAGGLALAALLVSLAARGVRGDQWPLAAPYEFALACAVAILVALLAQHGKPESWALGVGLMVLSLTVLLYARLGMPATAQVLRPLPPALDSIWLQLHAGTLAIAYGGFGAAAVAGCLCLTRGWLGRLTVLPSLETLEAQAAWGVRLGFPWMSLAMIAGAIWAQTAWGTYWSWEPKEVLALATWLVYLLYLHARSLRGWRGAPLATLAIVGLLLAMANYLWAGSLARSVELEPLRVY